MRTHNRATIIGHVGNEVVLRYTQGGKPVVNLNVATSYRRKDGPEVTTWHRIVLWDKLAELAEKYVDKGKAVYVEGKLTVREWTDKDGVTRQNTEITAHELIFLGRGAEADGAGDGATGRRSASGEELAEVREQIPF